MKLGKLFVYDRRRTACTAGTLTVSLLRVIRVRVLCVLWGRSVGSPVVALFVNEESIAVQT